ncbi:MAG: Ig-like domain-containing protein [Solobacterium sp.]|nr:Ig-like domain-containing protein [Solobacterium sp.]
MLKKLYAVVMSLFLTMTVLPQNVFAEEETEETAEEITETEEIEQEEEIPAEITEEEEPAEIIPEETEEETPEEVIEEPEEEVIQETEEPVIEETPVPEEIAEEEEPAEITPEETEEETPEEVAEEPEEVIEETEEPVIEETPVPEEITEEEEPAEIIPEETEEEIPEEVTGEPEEVIEETEEEPAEEEEPVHILTWEEFLDENTEDSSALTKEEYVELSAAYEAYRLEAIRTPEGESIDGASSGHISNEYLDVSVGSDGRFSIGNVEGNPNYTSDNGKKLIYGYPDTGTSTTLIYVDGTAHVFTADTSTYRNNKAVSSMMIGDITVYQTLSLVSSESSSVDDVVRIEYKVINTGTGSKNVGVRIMLDTMLASNDYAPFKVKGTGNLTTIRNYDSATGIPDSYQVYDDLNNPTTIATGYLVRSGEIKPDRVQFTNWPAIKQNNWNYIGSVGSSLGDSAVGIYWDPASLGSGKSKTVATYYGVGVGVAMGSNANQNTTIDSSSIGITVIDNKTGDEIEGASIKLTAQDGTVSTGVTGADGFAVLDWNYPSKEQASVEVTAADYRTRTETRDIKGGDRISVALKRTDDNTPLIESVTMDGVDVMNGTVHYIDNSGSHIDKAKQENIKIVKLIVKSDMQDCVYYLTEDNKVISKNTKGVFEFKTTQIKNGTVIEKFNSGKVRKVYCVAPDGTVSRKISLGVKVSIPSVAVSTISDLNLWPYGGTNLATGTLGALLLGDEIGFGLKNGAKLKIEVGDDGKVKVSYNLDSMPNAQTEYKIEQAKEEFKRTSQLKRSAKDIFGGSLAKGDKTAKLGVPFHLEFDYGGYGEGIIKDGSVNVDVTIFGTAKVEGSYTVNFFFTVPLYITVGAGGSIGATITGSAYVATDGSRLGLNLKGQFNPQVYVSVEGGIGSSGIASLGVEGKGTLSYKFTLPAVHHLATLTGEANLKAKFLVFEKSLNLAKATVKIYDSEDRNGESYDTENLYEKLDEIPFKLRSRDYLRNESPEGEGEDDFGLPSENIATEEAPVVINAGDKKYRFWIEENFDRSVANGPMLVYSVFEDGYWSDSIPVEDDGTADFSPAAVYDNNGHVYVVWENTSQVFDDSTVTVDEMGNAQEICVKVLDTGTNEFGPVTAVTSNDVIDANPAVTAYNGSAYIVWNRVAGSLLDNNSNNSICYVSYTDGAVSEEHVTDCGTMSVADISAMTSQSGPVAMYTIFDSGEGINAVQKTYSLSMLDASAEAVPFGDEEAVSVSGAKSATLNGEPALFWMQDGNILYRTGTETEKVFAADGYKMDDFAVADGGNRTYLIWKSTLVTGEAEEGEVPESSSVLNAVCYENGTWGNPYVLLDCDCDLVKNVMAEVNEEGNLLVSYIAVNFDDEGNISSSSLVEQEVYERTDISLESFIYDENEAFGGETLPVTAVIRNAGSGTVDEVTVHISGDSTSYERTFTGLALKPGETAELTVDDFVPAEPVGDGNLYNYTAEVTSEEDADYYNGTEDFTLGYTCLVAEQQESIVNDGMIYYPVKVSNISKTDAKQVSIKMLADSVDGSIVYDNTLDELKAGQSVYVYIPAETLENSSEFYTYLSTETPIRTYEDGLYTRMACSSETISYVTESEITIQAEEGGRIVQGESGQYVNGQQIELTAEADEGYVFAGWTADDGSFDDASSASAIYYVPENDAVVTAGFIRQEEITELTLSETEAAIRLGKSLTLRAMASDELSWALLDWSTSDESVASVSRTGKVTAVKEGTAVITAALKSNPDVSASCTITVEPAEITSLRMVYPRITLNGEGDEKQLKVDLVTDPEDSLAELVWESDNPEVAVVDENGLVRAVADGTATVTVRAATDETLSSACIVNVVTPIADIAFSTEDITISVGDEPFELTASAIPDYALRSHTFAWEAGDESMIAIETQGEHNETVLLTALEPGTTLLTASAGDTEKTVRINVLSPAREISLNNTELSIRMTDTANLTASVLPANTTDNVVWRSTDSSVASVSNGMVRTYAPGTATITATAGSVSASCVVTVYEVKATGLTLSETSATLTKGDSYRITATKTPSNTTDVLEWTSSNSDIASVSSGTIYANRPGKATITAKCGKVSAKFTVTVVQKQYETITVTGVKGFESEYTDAETHYYANSINKVWKLTTPTGVNGVQITFDANTEFENNYDYLQVLDKDGEPVSFTRSDGTTADRITGSNFKNETITITSFPVRLLMHTDGSVVRYGFKVKKIKYNYNLAKATVTPAKTSYVYTGKAITPAVTVTVGSKTLKKDTDYKVTYKANKAIGTATITITALGAHSGSKSATFKILPQKVSGFKQSSTKETSMKLSWTKMSGITGYKIYKYANSKYTLVKTITSASTVSYALKNLKAGTKYKYAVSAYLKKNDVVYEGAKYGLYVSTLPKAPTLTGTAATKAVKLTWKKPAGATGYVIYYSTTKTGTYKKAATIKDAATLKTTIKNLTSKKKYYFKIRAYTKTTSGTIYSAYSKVIAVTAK